LQAALSNKNGWGGAVSLGCDRDTNKKKMRAKISAIAANANRPKYSLAAINCKLFTSTIYSRRSNAVFVFANGKLTAVRDINEFELKREVFEL
jgi:hypothetical protein